MYVPRRKRTTTYSYKPSTARGVLQTTVKRKTTYKRKKYPPRLAGSRYRYNVARVVNNVVNAIAENKITPVIPQNEVTFTPIQLGAIAHTKSFCIGTIPSVWSGIAGLTTLGGVQIPNGTGRAQRNGHYVFLEKTHLRINLENNQLPGRCPVQVRMLVIKANRRNNPTGLSNPFDTTLFLDSGGNDFGHATAGINGTDLMVQPVNKKDWYCKLDKKFVMSPVNESDASNPSSNTSKYPITKEFVLNLPYYKKTEFDGLNNEPINLDSHWVVVFYARAIGKDQVADGLEVNIRGSTTFKDN